MKERKPTTYCLALVVVVLMALPAGVWAQAEPQLPDPGSTRISREQQIEAGKKAAAQVYKQMPVLPDSDPVTQYVQQLGRKLVAVIPEQYSWPYEFHVLQQKEINAFALPGGPIFVNLGTIQAADNEAELVGVMAHEMSHVYMMHSAKAAGKQSLLQGLAGVVGGVLGGGAGGLANLGFQTLALKYSRGDEAQADHVGAIIMYQAGYDPKAMADFFAKLERQGGSGPQFLSDHPNPGNREAAIQKEIAHWPPEEYEADSAAFVQAKEHLGSIKGYSAQEIQQHARKGGDYAGPKAAGQKAPDSGQDGSVSNVSLPQVAPSGQYLSFEHSGFVLDYPSNWKAYGGRDSAVTIAPPQGISQNAVAYGVIINQFRPQNQSLDSAMQELVANIKQSNPDLEAIGESQLLKVNGTAGRSLDLVGNSPIHDSKGGSLRERDWLVALPRSDGSLLYLVFIAPEQEFSRLREDFEYMLKSIKLS